MLILRYKKLSTLFALLTALFLIQSAFTNPETTILNNYALSDGIKTFIILAIAIPYAVISLIALVGYLRLHAYVSLIVNSNDGQAFERIGKGIFWLAFWLPVAGIVSLATATYAEDHSSATTAMINLRNYINLLILIPAFWLTLDGSKKLLRVAKKSQTAFRQPVITGFIAFSATYTALALHHADGRTAHIILTNDYYQPEWLTVTTLIIPRLIVWYWGLRSIYNLYIYRVKIRAPIYRRAVGSLASGLTVVLGTLMLVRCLQTLGPGLSHPNLGVLLIAAYLILILMGAGYLYIAKGARDLQKIEEI